MSSGCNASYNLVMPCCAEEMETTVEKIIFLISRHECQIEDIIFRVEMACKEMLANAVEHGCISADEEIMIYLKTGKNQVSVSVKDPGEGFDWESFNFDMMPLLKERGRGLCMINTAADEVYFNDRGNKITARFVHRGW